MHRPVLLMLILLLASPLHASDARVFQMSVEAPMQSVYDRVYRALEEEGFYVVFEVDVGANLARFGQKWGENYNRNSLDGIRSMVFCNGWYANAVGNADPAMLALCPLRVTLMEKAGTTTVLFARPSVIAADSPARGVVERIEKDVIGALRKGIEAR